jgi:hypothetical protein
VAAGIAAAIGWGVKLALPALHPAVVALAVLAPYGVAYFAMAVLLGVPEARTLLLRRSTAA